MDGWVKSRGHKDNILRDKFSQIGIGVYFDNGTVYWSQLFTD
ncbi:MAG: CAP domain-containing protein [Gottschalkiaceae bacterium]|nr:MAG: CAP domain-containing protein [Gottschalkiaceae bacterium]